jgi:hypothetical protein
MRTPLTWKAGRLQQARPRGFRERKTGFEPATLTLARWWLSFAVVERSTVAGHSAEGENDSLMARRAIHRGQRFDGQQRRLQSPVISRAGV